MPVIDPNLARTIRALPEALLPLSGTEVTAISQTNPDFPILSAIPFRTVQIDLTDLPGGGGGISGPPDQVLYFGAIGSVTSDALFVRDPSTLSTTIGVGNGQLNINANADLNSVQPFIVMNNTTFQSSSGLAVTGIVQFNSVSNRESALFVTDGTTSGLGPDVVYVGINDNGISQGSVASIYAVPGGTMTYTLQVHDNLSNKCGLVVTATSFAIENNNVSWNWPTTDGSSNYVLTTDGAGNLSFAAGGLPSGSDYQVLALNGSPSPMWVNVINDASGGTSLDFFNRMLFDNNVSTLSIDWNGRTLKDTSGGTVLDWGEGIDIGSGHITLAAVPYQFPNSQGAAGTVLNNDGSGNLTWGPPFKFYIAGPTVGGAQTEALSVPGLTGSNTIVSLSQQSPGSHNTALTGYISQNTNSLTCQWTADPGTGAFVLILYM